MMRLSLGKQVITDWELRAAAAGLDYLLSRTQRKLFIQSLIHLLVSTTSDFPHLNKKRSPCQRSGPTATQKQSEFIPLCLLTCNVIYFLPEGPFCKLTLPSSSYPQ